MRQQTSSQVDALRTLYFAQHEFLAAGKKRDAAMQAARKAGCSYEDIAHSMGVATMTVWNKLNRTH